MKRSSQVALLLMGTVAVGGGAYALMPRENCQPNQPGHAQPGSPQATQCSPRSSSSSSGGYYGRSSSSSSSSHLSTRQGFSGADGSSGSSTVHGGGAPIARGGFGSFASHFTGGG